MLHKEVTVLFFDQDAKEKKKTESDQKERAQTPLLTLVPGLARRVLVSVENPFLLATYSGVFFFCQFFFLSRLFFSFTHDLKMVFVGVSANEKGDDEYLGFIFVWALVFWIKKNQNLQTV